LVSASPEHYMMTPLYINYDTFLLSLIRTEQHECRN